MEQLFLFCSDLRHRFADDRCFLSELPYIYMVFYCTNIFRNNIRIRVKMSEKSLMVESKEDEAERLHFQKVTLLHVESITNMVHFLLVFRIRRINIGPPRSGLYP
jgi:hypothetical protein